MIAAADSIEHLLARAIDEVATDFVFLADATPPELGGPFITYMNRPMLDAFGYALRDVLGKNPSMFWGPHTDLDAVRQLRTNIGLYREACGEFLAYRRDGESFWVQFRGKVLGAPGRPETWIAIGRDITAERRQRIENAQLVQFKTDLIAMLAHDFRGPLTAIAGFAELMEEADDLAAADRHDMLRTIQREAKRLANFAGDTLTVARLETDGLTMVHESFDLVEAAREVLDIYAAREGIEFEAPPHLALCADRARLQQVLDNLLSNAIKYSGAAASIRVSVRADGGEAILAVRDSGIGIPPEDMPLIFQRYARGGNARSRGISGTGFGLYVVDAIVRHHGGRVEVESAAGQGTAFTVRIPLARPGASAG